MRKKILSNRKKKKPDKKSINSFTKQPESTIVSNSLLEDDDSFGAALMSNTILDQKMMDKAMGDSIDVRALVGETDMNISREEKLARKARGLDYLNKIKETYGR